MKKKILLFVAMALTMGYVASGREDGKCECGGKLTWTAHCFSEKVTCYYCKGKGTITGGGISITCGVCEGTGEYTKWTPGYKCTTCGSKYSNWSEEE